ncbi:hypothetical protein C8R44DRAFT_845700 [Mycena epipterygia]|nr:hypothetical protein C8R44DRAFT_845700 [Mycena epipterygia]
MWTQKAAQGLRACATGRNCDAGTQAANARTPSSAASSADVGDVLTDGGAARLHLSASARGADVERGLGGDEKVPVSFGQRHARVSPRPWMLLRVPVCGEIGDWGSHVDPAGRVRVRGTWCLLPAGRPRGARVWTRQRWPARAWGGNTGNFNWRRELSSHRDIGCMLGDALEAPCSCSNVKKNKEECTQLMENIHELLYAVVNLHVKSGMGSSLPPATLSAFGELTETLHKVHAFMEAQQDGNRIRHFFRQSELKTLLNECHTGLQHAVDMFKMEGAINLHGDIVEMQKETLRIHKELLESISTSSDATMSDRSSSIHHWANDLHNSSNSISMLPATPKIFHGRESELKDIVKTLNQEPARIAILGAGGMGKTSLAKATLHHPDIVSKYEQRFFVAADSAATSIELTALIGLHIGLQPGTDLAKQVVHYFSNNGPSLLILDNLETVWEPVESRGAVEELLSRLTDVSHLALMAKRPAKVRWTHPFLDLLKPLSDIAARQIFVDIAEDFHNSKDITQLLALTDNMPLAVDLIAHLVDYEGCDNVLARWGSKKTSLLSSGHDRTSNLDISITISLSSPRLSSDAKDLLSLLSILPDGLSAAELLQIKLPIKHPLECRSTLLRTSLAYEDDRKRLKSLVPIREHMQHFYPAPLHLIHQIEKHFHLLLNVFASFANHGGSQQVTGHINQITLNLGNVHQVLLRALQQGNPTLVDTINCAILLNRFNRAAGYGRHTLMNHIPAALSSVCDDRLEVLFIVEVFNSRIFHPIDNPEQLIAQAINHFCNFNDLLLESEFYRVVGDYSFFSQGNILRATELLEKALLLAETCENKRQQATVMLRVAIVLCSIGNHPAAQINAHRAQKLAQLSASLDTEASSLWIEAMCAQSFGDYKRSMALFHRGKTLLELCGMSGGPINHNIMTSQAETHMLKSEYAEARNINTELAQNTQKENYCAFSLLNVAQIDIMIGASVQDVHQNLDRARGMFTAAAGPHASNYFDIRLGELNLRERETCTAKDIFQQCFNSEWQNDSQAALLCLEKLADTSQWPTCDFEYSSRWTMVYLVYSKGKESKRALHKALQYLGDVFLTQGDLNTASSLFTVALETFTHMDIHCSRAECMLRLGDIARHRGDLAQAEDLWKEACPLFERSLQAKDMAQIDTRLALVVQEVSERHQNSLLFLNKLQTPTMSVDELPIPSDTEHLVLQIQGKTLGFLGGQ